MKSMLYSRLILTPPKYILGEWIVIFLLYYSMTFSFNMATRSTMKHRMKLFCYVWRQINDYLFILFIIYIMLH